MEKRCIKLRDLGWAADRPLLLIECTNHNTTLMVRVSETGEGVPGDKPIAGLAILAGNIIDW